MRTVLLCLFFISATLADYISYEGYTTYEITPTCESQAATLHELYKSGRYDFWTPVRTLNHPVTVMVAPELKQRFTSILDNKNMQYSISIHNVEATIQQERVSQARAPKAESGRISFDAYYRYDAILDYLDQLASDYPDIVSVEDYGTSYEGRALTLIRIGTDGLPSSKPTIFIEGGIHAREWIAPAVVLYIIQQLVENEDNIALIENANWVIVPATNPDGYEFTHTDNRMWRKTRRIGTVCNGVDANRNFDFEWGGVGASTSECAEDFRGPYAFSEVEALALAEVALEIENISLFLSFHSFGNWILYSWGHTLVLPDNAEELHTVGQSAADAIEAVYGTRYVVGNSAILLYFTTGTSHDWMKGAANISLSYTVELPGGAGNGFILPPERIQAVVQETWQGMLSFYSSALNSKK